MLLSTCSGGKRSLGSFVLPITPSILWCFLAHLPPTSPHDTFSIGLFYLMIPIICFLETQLTLDISFWSSDPAGWLSAQLTITVDKVWSEHHLVLTLKISNLYLVIRAKMTMLREASPILPKFSVDMNAVANSLTAEQNPHTSTVSRRWGGGFE